MTTYDPKKMAAMAAQLRAGARRPDPNSISVSRLQEIGAQSLKLAAALGSDAARRQPAAPTMSEQAQIDRVVREQAQWFGAPEDDHHR